MTELAGVEISQHRQVCVVIPTYDNAGTVAQVATAAHAYCQNVIVVDDGSNDETPAILKGLECQGITIVSHDKNRGKGCALKTGFLKAMEMGYSHVITMDADGQHYPSDIPQFMDCIERYPDAIIVGSRNLESENMPGKNTFANRFSNFWFTVQTWHRLADTQSGYRAYPLKKLIGLRFLTSGYEAELMLLVLAAWAGVELRTLPINVYYPPRGERVTHFRPGMDFLRISVLNTVLCILAVVYGWPRMILKKIKP